MTDEARALALAERLIAVVQAEWPELLVHRFDLSGAIRLALRSTVIRMRNSEIRTALAAGGDR